MTETLTIIPTTKVNTMAVPSEEVAEVFSNLGDLEKEFAEVELTARTCAV